jgi:undecaprenyl phosphate N,N'-diacetylbacillosamine 1-phosphate transferase
MTYLRIKRIIDVFISLFLLIVLFPIILIVGIILMLSLKGNPFFVQARPGKSERIFRLIKFRTMNNNKDDKGELLPDDARLTTVGKLIRHLSLDELPQLINIIKGDMSLIGPRPLLIEYLPYYNDIQKKRHDIRPGITGWAQVHGRNAISWEKKFEFDVWYVENVSFVTDLKVIFLTFKKVIKSEGINFVEPGTDQRFRGSK